jgi:hypothetical protein
MSDFGFGRCDGHHEMIDFKLRKKPRLGAGLSRDLQQTEAACQLGAALLWRTRDRDAERPSEAWVDYSALRIAASEEGVPAIFGAVVSLDLINAFATNRTKPKMKLLLDTRTR